MINNKEIGIYIHIPFCKSKCYYCDFASCASKENLIEDYINALCKQILQNAEIFSEYNISTVYFGGGTPSYIDSKYIEKIMNVLLLFAKDIKELTIEINPGTITLEKLETYKKLGINRLSIGLQSTLDTALKSIGRIHTYTDFLNTLDLAKKCDFTNISVDLMYPLPNISFDNFKESIDKIIKLKDEYNIKHISVYNLEVHEGTKLDFLLNEGFLNLVNEDEEYKMKCYLEETLSQNGFERYEISNFAIPGYQSNHNLNYWNQGQYIGIGSAASSFFAGRRYTNISDIQKYIDCISKNETIVVESEDLDKLDLMKEYVILNLRVIKGVSKNKFKARFNTDINKIFASEIKELLKDNLIIEKAENICLSKRGLEVANIVWEKFI